VDVFAILGIFATAAAFAETWKIERIARRWRTARGLDRRWPMDGPLDIWKVTLDPSAGDLRQQAVLAIGWFNLFGVTAAVAFALSSSG